jgi:hypothetical protein
VLYEVVAKKQHALKAWSSASHASGSTDRGYEAERSAYRKMASKAA